MIETVYSYNEQNRLLSKERFGYVFEILLTDRSVSDRVTIKLTAVHREELQDKVWHVVDIDTGSDGEMSEPDDDVIGELAERLLGSVDNAIQMLYPD